MRVAAGLSRLATRGRVATGGRWLCGGGWSGVGWDGVECAAGRWLLAPWHALFYHCAAPFFRPPSRHTAPCRCPQASGPGAPRASRTSLEGPAVRGDLHAPTLTHRWAGRATPRRRRRRAAAAAARPPRAFWQHRGPCDGGGVGGGVSVLAPPPPSAPSFCHCVWMVPARNGVSAAARRWVRHTPGPRRAPPGPRPPDSRGAAAVGRDPAPGSEWTTAARADGCGGEASPLFPTAWPRPPRPRASLGRRRPRVLYGGSLIGSRQTTTLV